MFCHKRENLFLYASMQPFPNSMYTVWGLVPNTIVILIHIGDRQTCPWNVISKFPNLIVNERMAPASTH